MMTTTMNKRKRKRSMWTERRENIFVEMWEEKIEELRGERKNSHIYKEMAAELAEKDIEISPQEVKAKITNLTTKFRKFKSCIGPSGGSPSNWPLYDRINRLIGSQPIHNSTGIVDDSIIDIQFSQSGCIDLTDIASDGESSLSQKSQSPNPSLNVISPTLSSAEKPSSSCKAENEKFIEIFEKSVNSFEQAIGEDKMSTEELLALEREKIYIFKNISDSTDKLTSGILHQTDITSDGDESSRPLQSQLLNPSLNDISPTLSSAEKPSSSREARNKLIEIFEKFGNSFEQAIEEDKKSTEELLALEREKIKIFKNISDSTEKLTGGILNFLKNSNKKDFV